MGCYCNQPAVLLLFSSLSRFPSSRNWQVMDLSDTANRKKYYINVCRPINPVSGCDRHASVCQMKYINDKVCNKSKSVVCLAFFLVVLCTIM